ncbi:MAG: hypothetical protein IPJ66_18150 [Bacteroidetes bacterium]|nr:hypothetical protein [Bacteroidota bacterium]
MKILFSENFFHVRTELSTVWKEFMVNTPITSAQSKYCTIPYTWSVVPPFKETVTRQHL